MTAGVVGLRLPAIMLLAFLPILGIAGAYSRLNRVEPNAGNGYVWVGRSLTPWLGFLVGWVNIVATVAFLAYTTAVTGSAMLQLREAGLHGGGTGAGPGFHRPDDRGGHRGPRRRHPHRGHRGQDRGPVAERAARLRVRRAAGLLRLRHRHRLLDPFRLSWFDPFAIPSASALAQGLLLSVFCYWGFEAAFTVNEEVRDPRDASRAGLITLVTMLGLFLLGSIAFHACCPSRSWPGTAHRGWRSSVTGCPPSRWPRCPWRP